MANTLQVDIVTPYRSLFSGRAEMVTLPGSLGQMGILPGHAPLLSTLDIGEIILHMGNDSQFVAVSGGVVEVRPDKVTILADTAETPEDIDAARAPGCASPRAEQLLATNPPPARAPCPRGSGKAQQPAAQSGQAPPRPPCHRGAALRAQIGWHRQVGTG